MLTQIDKHNYAKEGRMLDRILFDGVILEDTTSLSKNKFVESSWLESVL